MRHGDDLPLQPLGGVHGQDLHPVVRDGDLGGRQPVLHLHRGVEVGEQPGTVAPGARCEVGDDVGERIEVLGAGPAGRHRLRRTHFGVDAEHPAHLGDEVGQRMVQLRAQRGQLAAERHDAAIPLGEYRSARTRVADGVGQAGGVGVRRRGGHDRRRRAHDRRSGRDRRVPRRAATARRRRAAPSRQRGPVSTRIAAAPAVGSATSRSIATTSATSGMASSPASPTTSTGTPRAVSASAIGAASALRRTSTAAVGIGRTGARVHRGRSSAKWSATQSRSADDVGQQRAPDGAGLGVGPRQQLAHGHRPAARLRRDRVGQLQRPRRIAPAGAQFQRGRRACRPRGRSRW